MDRRKKLIELRVNQSFVGRAKKQLRCEYLHFNAPRSVAHLPVPRIRWSAAVSVATCAELCAAVASFPVACWYVRPPRWLPSWCDDVHPEALSPDWSNPAPSVLETRSCRFRRRWSVARDDAARFQSAESRCRCTSTVGCVGVMASSRAAR